MFWNLWLGLAALLGLAAAADTVIYQDADTGLTFSSAFALYKSDGRGITFRVAIPGSASNYQNYDAVIQLVVPNDVGWAGIAWGGSMTRNPLLAVWRGSNNAPVTTSRWATAHQLPTVYNSAQYTVYKTGTKSNSTHWQVTALCTGCTSWSDTAGSTRYLNPKGGNRLAFAYSPNKPSNPSSNTSSFPVHDVHGYWSHDFNAGLNANFEAAVARLQR